MNATDSGVLKFVADASGAFFGAFFAFIFGLVTYYWTKWVEKQKEDYDTMVKLEGILNEHLNICTRNEYLLRTSIFTLNKGAMTYNILRKYRIIEDLELSFLDNDLINKYFDYRDLIYSLNNDFDVANKATDILREVSLNGKVPVEAIKFNAQILVTQLTELNKMVAVTNDETKKLLCLIRIKIQKDKPGIVGIHRLFWQPYKPSDAEIKKEMAKLEKEIIETKKMSKELISKRHKK